MVKNRKHMVGCTHHMKKKWNNGRDSFLFVLVVPRDGAKFLLQLPVRTKFFTKAVKAVELQVGEAV